MPRIKFPQYFRTRDGLVCHTLSELCHLDKSNVIGLPKYFPAHGYIDNARVIDGRAYLDHLPTFYDSMERTRLYYDRYMRFVPFLGEELCVFNVKKDIERIYDPRMTAKQILVGECNNIEIFSDAKKLLTTASEILAIPLKCFGIEGSLMLGCSRSNSDIDLVVYGEKWAASLIKNFMKLKSCSNIHLYGLEDIDLIYSRRCKYRSFRSYEELLTQEKRRTVGLFNGRRFWLQPVLGTSAIESRHRGRKIFKVDLLEDEFIVTDAKRASLWPAFYELRNRQYKKIIVECYDPIYMNQACKGDLVQIRGNLYVNKIGRESNYHVIMGPWITTTQYLRNITV